MTAVQDAIVVGARCAGSPKAMLLAGEGYRILRLDRAGFPRDTLYSLRPPTGRHPPQALGSAGRVLSRKSSSLSRYSGCSWAPTCA